MEQKHGIAKFIERYCETCERFSSCKSIAIENCIQAEILFAIGRK